MMTFLAAALLNDLKSADKVVSCLVRAGAVVVAIDDCGTYLDTTGVLADATRVLVTPWGELEC